MPRIPIIPPREYGDGGTGGGPEALPPEQAAALRALEVRTARIDRELAVSQSWSAAVDRLAEAEDADEGPPPGFTRSFLDAADKDRAAMLKILPPDRQGELEQDLLSLREGFADRAASVEASGMALRRRAGLYRTLEGYRNGVARDPGLFDEASSRMAALAADLGLPEDRRDAMRRHVRAVLGHAAVDGLMTDPARAARVLSDGLFDDVLPEASKARRLGEAQAAVAREQRLARERAVSDLTAQSRQGTAPDEALLSAERDGTLGPAEAAYLRQANAKAAEEASLREARIRRVATATDPLDPSNADDRAAVSDYWETIAEVYASDNPERQRDAELGFVLRTGVLPDGLSRQYQGALLSVDPGVAVAGATALANLQRENPALVAVIPEDRLRRADTIARYAELNLPPERAIALAERDLEREEVSTSEEAKAPEPPEIVAAETGGSLPQSNEASGEPVEPVREDGIEPGEDSATPTESDMDQTDGPFDGLEANGDANSMPDEESIAAATDGTGDNEGASALNRLTVAQLNEQLAAMQLTSPDTSRYEKLGPFTETDAGYAYVDASGAIIQADPNRHVILMDADRAEPSVFRRTPETDENRVLALGRYLGAMLGLGSPSVALGAGARGVQVLSKGTTGAATTLGSGIGPVARTVRTITGASKGEAWVVKEAVQGIGEGAGQVHKVVKPGRTVYVAEETALYITHKEPLAADVLKTGRPLGLTDDATFAGFKAILREEGAKLPPDTRFAIRGSAVTGNGFDKAAQAYIKNYFDAGRKSDHDIAIVSRTLLEKAQENGVALAGSNSRTAVLKAEQVSELGLGPLLQRFQKVTGRKKTTLMIYRSVDSLNKRGANVQFEIK